MDQKLKDRLRETFESNPDSIKDILEYCADLADNQYSNWTHDKWSRNWLYLRQDLESLILERFPIPSEEIHCEDATSDVEYAVCN